MLNLKSVLYIASLSQVPLVSYVVYYGSLDLFENKFGLAVSFVILLLVVWFRPAIKFYVRWRKINEKR